MSSCSIALLSEEVINQIAAGEVVENPASVIKELIENGLDAQATRIEVEIERGGFDLIRVEDNGSGMNRQEALLSLQRHATSKIRSAADLEILLTMGFRGEALAAISAVSRLTLISAPEHGEASCVRITGGQSPSWEPIARNRGTTIEVRALFENVPARKNFQKSERASSAQIVRTLETFALAHPHIHFTLTSDGRQLLHTTSKEPLQRIEEILSPPFLLQGKELHLSTPPYEIHGYLASVHQAKKTRLHQYFFLNQRAIFSPLIARAVKEGYSTHLPEALHPSFVLHLNAPPHLFDVNVHPQKKEVRFQNEKGIFTLVRQAVSEALHPTLSPTYLSFSDPLPWTIPTPSSTDPFAPSPFSFKEEQLPLPQSPIKDKGRPIALLDSFLLLQEDNGWRLVDLKAARTHLLLHALAHPTAKTDAQVLLMPLEFFLSRDEALSIEEWITEWETWGLIARQIGTQAIAIDAIPSWLSEEECIPFLALWKEETCSRERAIKTLQKLSRGTKKRYTLPEGIALWEQICSLSKEEPQSPISLLLNSPELAGLFERS